MSLTSAANAFRLNNSIAPGQPDTAVLGHGLADKDGNIAANAKHILAVGVCIPFIFFGSIEKSTRATGSVVFSGLPVDGQTITISDGSNPAQIFQANDGDPAVATITLTGVPADAGTVSIGDGTTSKVLEFDNGVAGVASTGGVFTFTTAAPVDGDKIVFTAHDGTTETYEFNNGGGVTAGSLAVFTGTSAATAATELISAIMGTGVWVSRGASTRFTATAGASGVVNLSRIATGAANQTITKTFATGANGTVTSSFSGGVTQVAPGSNITGGRVGVATSATPGGSALTTAQVTTNIINAINGVTGPAFLFTATQGAGTTVTLTANTKGTAGNAFTITESASNLTVSGSGNFSGGAAPGSGSRVGLQVQFARAATAALTATALRNAIAGIGGSFNISATNATPGEVDILATVGGVVGNVAIVSTLTNAVVTGMAGGVDATVLNVFPSGKLPEGSNVIVNGFYAAIDVDGTSWTAASLEVSSADGALFEINNSFLTAGSNTFLETAGLLGSGGGGIDSAGQVRLATGIGSTLIVEPNIQEVNGSPIAFKIWGVVIPPASV